MDQPSDWPDLDPVQSFGPPTQPVGMAPPSLGAPPGWPLLDPTPGLGEPDGTLGEPSPNGTPKPSLLTPDTSIVDGIITAAYGEEVPQVSTSGRVAGQINAWRPAPTGVLAVLYLLHGGAAFILAAIAWGYFGKLKHNLGVLAHGGQDVINKAAHASATGWFAFFCLTLIALHITGIVGLARGSRQGLNLTRVVFGAWLLLALSVLSQSLDGNTGIPMLQLIATVVLAGAGVGLTFTSRISDWCDRTLDR